MDARHFSNESNVDLKMDRYEKIAYTYLARHGHTPIVHEPDGNVPPDLLTKEKIAVEVRLLNQNIEHGGRVKGVGDEAFPLMKGIENHLIGIANPSAERSAYVSFSFRRPLPKLKKLKSLVSKSLPVGIPEIGEDIFYQLTPTVNMHVVGASKWLNEPYVYSGCFDDDSGGFVLSELIRNAQICIDEKTEKIKPYRTSYERWWLVLIDSISFGLNDLELEVLKSSLAVPDCWAYVSFINLQDDRIAFRI